MNSKREKLQYIYVFFADASALAVSVLLVWLVLDRVFHRITAYSMSDWLLALSALATAFLAAFLCFDQSENIVGRSLEKEIRLSLQFNILMGALYALLMMLVKAQMLESRYFALSVPLVNTAALSISHVLLRKLLADKKNKLKLQSMVGIITTCDRAEALLQDFRDDWSQCVCGLALIEAGPEQIGTEIEGVKIEANFDNFMDWIRRSALDELYVDIPLDSGESFMPYLEEIESMGLTVHLRIPMIDRIEKKCSSKMSVVRMSRVLERCAGGNMLTLGSVELDLRDRLLKRLLDIAGGFVGCLLSPPVVLYVGVTRELESVGSLLFRHERIRLNGRYFYIWKLRSMYIDAEERKKDLIQQNEINGLMFKIHDDPRITKVGKFIRRTSIDELPQFVNVLRGEMSLVGTRPPTVDEYEKYKSHHKRRLSMKPGITGLWQVSGRSHIDNFEDVVALDIQYIDNWSFWLDIKLLLKTVVVVFTGKGAE